jgi:acetylornithine deacetylase/succinyl-diaminopimelate desuccinylase-like protein
MATAIRGVTALSVVLASSIALLAQAGPQELRAREIFKQLVEINTTHSVGSTTTAAEAMAARFKAAGFPDADVRVLAQVPRKGNLIVRYRGTGAKRPLLLLAHLDVVEAKREDWSLDPFVLTSTGAARRTTRRWRLCSSPT